MPETAIPTTLITGFLGSGKTTLINALLRDSAMTDTAVLVNEFGEIGIDNLLIETLDDDDVLLLNAGCLCCTIRGDLVRALTSLFDKRADGRVPTFRRVIIETTGLADPAPLLHTLLSHEAVRDHYYVDNVVTTVDAVNGAGQLDTFEECLRQAAVADRLVITKGDIAGGHSSAELRRRLAAINPGARVIEASHGCVDPAQLFDSGLFDPQRAAADVWTWLNEAAHGASHTGSRHSDGIKTFCLYADVQIEMQRFVAWIERLLETRGDRLLRLKGILNIAGSETPIVVHGVQHIFHPLIRLGGWPDADRRTRIVFITKGLPRHEVVEEFERMVNACGAERSLR